MQTRYRLRGCPPAVGPLCVTALDRLGRRLVVEPCRDDRDANHVLRRMSQDLRFIDPKVEPTPQL